MTYDPNRIEIKSSGEVVRGGLVVGSITFSGLVGEQSAVGEHYAYEPGLREALSDAQRGIANLRRRIHTAINRLNAGDPPRDVARALGEWLL